MNKYYFSKWKMITYNDGSRLISKSLMDEDKNIIGRIIIASDIKQKWRVYTTTSGILNTFCKETSLLNDQVLLPFKTIEEVQKYIDQTLEKLMKLYSFL